MLGIHYDCENRKQPGVKPKSWQQAHRRCKRIGQAGRSKSKRTHLVRMLVLPKVLWSAAWVFPNALKLWGLRDRIARTINGARYGNKPLRCSNFLWWEIYGKPDVCPFFYAAKTVVQVHAWRCRRAQNGEQPTDFTGARGAFLKVIRRWGWEQEEGANFRTAGGKLALLEDGKAAIHHTMARAWRDWHWLREERVRRDHDCRERLQGRELEVGAHRKFATQPSTIERVSQDRVGLMYARHCKWPVHWDSRCRCWTTDSQGTRIRTPNPDRPHW